MNPQRQEDRRQDERIAKRCLVQLQPLDLPTATGPILHLGVTRDISAHGMGLWVNDQYPCQPDLLISIEQIEGRNTCITSLTGMVVRTHPERMQGRCLLGIRFTEGQALEIDDRLDGPIPPYPRAA